MLWVAMQCELWSLTQLCNPPPPPPRDAVRLLLLVLRFRVDTAGEVRRRAWSVNPTLSDKHIKQLLRALPAQSSFSCSPHGMLRMCVQHCVRGGALSVSCTCVHLRQG